MTLPTPGRASVLAFTLTLALAVPLAACSSSPHGYADATGLCPPKTTTASLPGAPSPAALTEVTSFGANPGSLKMFVHAPPSGKASAVVVALHGCTQDASAYVGAGWNELADKAGFAVVYPQQNAANNSQKCFRWYDKTQIVRDAGEARSIAAMTEHAKSQYGATHAFVTGLSAGAVMTGVMLATYPDLFEAGAIMAGLPYACATSQGEAYSCMSPGRDKTAEAWAALVPAAAHGGAAPRVSIWHGDADWIVRPMNETQLVRQWAGVAGVPSDPTTATTTKVGTATHVEYKDSAGVVRVESWLVGGMGHGVALAPKAGCGQASPYMLDEGLCSTGMAASFFGLVAADGTPTPPASAPGAAGDPARPAAPSSTGTGRGDCDP